MNRLHRCFNPESIAAIGGREAAQVLEQCQKFGFKGELHAVHPSQDALAGIKCIPDVSGLPGQLDTAFVAIPAESTINTVQSLREIETGGVVCYASGFGEVGDNERHVSLLQAADSMPLVGPNCYGYINALNGAVLWPDQHGLKRVDHGVAIFSGSGNLCVNISMQKRDLDIALLVSVGNQAIVSLEHCLEMAIEDDRITAIGLHIEGVKNITDFCQQAQRAVQAGKAIVVLKTGRSEMGAKIAMSHTASLAGSTELFDNLCGRLGIVQVDDLETFLETLQLLSVAGRISGNRLLSLSCSGGEASLVADLSQNMDLEFPDFSASLVEDIRLTLNDIVSISNPFDYHTFIWGDYDRLFATFTQALRVDVDLAILVLDIPDVDGCDNQDWITAANAFAAACRENDKKGAVVNCLGESMPTDMARHLIKSGIVPLRGLLPALKSIEAATKMNCAVSEVEIRVIDELVNREPVVLDELTAKERLAAAGLRIPENGRASTVDAAVKRASEIGYPVALKVVGTEFSHKTELQGVVLELQNEGEVEIEATRLLEIAEAVLVEEMITGALGELLVGVNYDEQFGHHLVLGFGGTLVELIADRRVLLLPATDEQIEGAIRALKMSPVFFGYRGKPKADVSAMVAAVRSVISYVENNRETVSEIDINPLIVTEHDAIAVDALIIERR